MIISGTAGRGNKQTASDFMCVPTWLCARCLKCVYVCVHEKYVHALLATTRQALTWLRESFVCVSLTRYACMGMTGNSACVCKLNEYVCAN